MSKTEVRDQEIEGSATKNKIVQAARETLANEGFAGASARAIARRGGFNQALIFYHFGSVMALMLRALDASSEERLARYREATKDVGLTSLPQLARDLYREDLEGGHITVLGELIAGSLSRPEASREIARRVQPWIDLATEILDEVLETTGLRGVVDPATLAYGVVAAYLGVDLLVHLDGNTERAEELFEAVAQVWGLVTPLLGGEAT